MMEFFALIGGLVSLLLLIYLGYEFNNWIEELRYITRYFSKVQDRVDNLDRKVFPKGYK